MRAAVISGFASLFVLAGCPGRAARDASLGDGIDVTEVGASESGIDATDTAAPIDAPDVPPLRLPDVFTAPGEPRFHRVFRAATHNSYWIQRDSRFEAFASGTQQRLLDQLLFNHVRAIEIDVHHDPAAPHTFRVFHTDSEEHSLCSPLTECLAMLRTFHHLVPDHEAVTVVLELKETMAFNFDAQTTPADLDRAFTDALGPLLYTPRDFLARCAPGSTMRACAREASWPTTREMRGRFVLAVISNYRVDFTTEICHLLHPRDPCLPAATDDIQGHGPAGWVDYATLGGGVAERAGFPMRSNWIHFNDSPAAEQVDPVRVGAADDASVFWQAEDLADPQLPEFVEANGLVRGADSFSLDAQAARIAYGFQFLQTDHPWLQLQDRGPARPFRSLDASADDEALLEPGKRLSMRGPDGAQVAFASTDVPGDVCTTWETAVSSTRVPTDARYPTLARPRGVGCIRAWSDPTDDAADGAMLCRATDDSENAVITLTTRLNGATSTTTSTSPARQAAGIGDLIRLVVCTNAGQSRVTAFSAGSVDSTGNPAWTPVGDATFTRALRHQGIAASRDVLFVGAHRDGNFVSSLDLGAPVVPHDATTPPAGPASIEDRSYPVPSPACHDPGYPIGCRDTH